jgi:hypothetical protein
LTLAVPAILVSAVLAACGGSSSTISLPQQQNGSSNSASATSSTTATTTFTPVSASGIESILTLPVATVATVLTETISIAPPASVPALAIARGARSARSAQATDPSAIAYLQIAAAASVTLDGTPVVTFTLPTSTSGISYELASYSGTSWNDDFEGPVIGSGTTVNFPLVSTGTTTVSPAAPLEYAVYAVTAPSPSPSASPSISPSPSPSPSPTPIPTPVASPGSLVFDATSPAPQSLIVPETGDTAAFTSAIVCNAASPAPSPAPSDDFVANITTPPNPSGPSETFTVNGGNLLGTCTITITDARGASIMVPVAVDETGATISTTGRKH